MPKTIIYQLLPRLYTNTRDNNKPNGTITENGSGKLNDINDDALQSLVNLGITHVWYTGIIRHASATRYPSIPNNANANVVKGQAGSPYAIIDYYDVDPDLAQNIDNRLDEWRALVQRTHAHGLKVIIDFVPNHVARQYHSNIRPETSLGINDDPSQHFSPQNNFYYLPSQSLTPPVSNLDVPYTETPTKASGNDAFTSAPSIHDWYETVKLNFGRDYTPGGTDHFDPRPDTWNKMRDILLYWIQTGVDGFRVDMTHMVPVQFWQWLIPQITARHPNTTFIGEIYDINKYNDYIKAGFNTLYDKVNFYDTIRDVITGAAPANAITHIWRRTENQDPHLLYFLENHDEQRIASQQFAADPLRARPAYTLALTMSRAATMIYAGQELGEPANDSEGYSGHDGRTTIFDYWSVPSLRRNVSAYKFDGSGLLPEERSLHDWYARLNNLVQQHEALSTGNFYDLLWINQHIWVDSANVYAYLRYNQDERFLIVLNFAATSRRQRLRIPDDAWRLMGSTWNECITPYDLLGNALFLARDSVNNIKQNGLEVEIPPHDALILKI